MTSAACSGSLTNPKGLVSAAQNNPEPAVLWITGFSSAGKTTVGRKVKLLLEEKGVNVVFLDGDDLRAIFGGKWGYERTDRIELAHAYFRLCNTLAAQGVTVIICAVAMYEEIYTWFRTNVDRSVQVYLKVPTEERVSRDKATKNIYQSMGDVSKLYDEPSSPDIVIENYGPTSPDNSARLIIEAYTVAIGRSVSDKGRTGHWNSYYKGAGLVFDPSDFAVSVSEHCQSVSLLEIGCGNGRDAVYFAQLGNAVTALDPSTEAINLCRSRHGHKSLEFLNNNLPDICVSLQSNYDVIYTRFCLHAMTEKEEIENLKAAYRILKPKGRLFIECRSINDPLARKGEVISPTERIHGHYRRFIIIDELKKRLETTGFQIDYAVESDNLAVLGDDNPVVIRVHATKL
ncbi:adenylyl-sulfate kinase [Geobacter sp.]|uniref:adenylyl-sulfate kinase n=1 Tax=Geobacter sp. TaxID=46610 RepID=UPI0027B993A9|nr:adenylyl-sulfate kinase [Geobacter sp.]